MDYQLLFEASISTFEWWLILIPLSLIAAGVFTIKRFSGTGKPLILFIGWYAVVFSALVLILMVGGEMDEYYRIQSALRNHTYSVTEGTVEHFKPMPYEGHHDESFYVNGVVFSYSDYGSTQCFHNSASHGGPIRNGMRVRISYVDKCIIRIETPPQSRRNVGP